MYHVALWDDMWSIWVWLWHPRRLWGDIIIILDDMGLLFFHPQRWCGLGDFHMLWDLHWVVVYTLDM
eukprot:11065902-Ditylum_brightwellii.AAC.1